MNLIDRIYAHNKEVSSSDYTSNYNSVLNRFMIWVSGGLWDDYILSCISDVKDTYSVMLLNEHHNPYRNGNVNMIILLLISMIMMSFIL